jgi:hypothetical protein
MYNNILRTYIDITGERIGPLFEVAELEAFSNNAIRADSSGMPSSQLRRRVERMELVSFEDQSCSVRKMDMTPSHEFTIAFELEQCFKKRYRRIVLPPVYRTESWSCSKPRFSNR